MQTETVGVMMQRAMRRKRLEDALAEVEKRCSSEVALVLREAIDHAD